MSVAYRYRINCDGKTEGDHARRRIAEVTVVDAVTGTGNTVREARVTIAQGRRPSSSDSTRTLYDSSDPLAHRVELRCPKCRAQVLLGWHLATDERTEMLTGELDGAITLRMLHAVTR